MSVSDAWDETTPSSTSRMNRTTVVTDTGSNLAALDKTKHKIVTASSTASGFTKDHAYLFTEDGLSKLDLSSVQDHSHTSTAGDGGSFADIVGNNSDTIDLCLTKTTDLLRTDWIQTTTGSATIEDDTTPPRAIRLRPNGTSGSGATISYPHLKLDFSKNSTFTTGILIETATSCAYHTGVGADDITAADSNTRKYQAEFCTTTNNNWWLRTANGSAQSGSDTGVAINTSKNYIQMKHFPTLGTPEVDLYPTTSTVFQKTTNIPIDSTTTDSNIIKHSIKNNTAADRPLKTYGSRLVYTANDSGWF